MSGGINKELAKTKMPKAPQPAGTVRVMRRFPVKGMAGEKLGEIFVSFAGMVGDRVYAYFDPQCKNDFPWMTPRIWAKMLLLKPKFVEPAVAHADRPSPKNYRVEITTPKGTVFDIGDQNLLKYMEQQFGRPVILRFSERCMHDARPISIFGHKTLEALSTETGIKLDAQRFRMNFEIDWAKGGAFFENELVGKQIRIGENVTLYVSKLDMRCKTIALDPDTAESSPEVLQVVADKHDGSVGIYATVLREGIVRRGDPVFVD